MRRLGVVKPEAVVAMGDRAFLVHDRTNAVGQLLVGIAVTREPLHHRISDDESHTARVVLLVITPPRHAARYLQVVGAFARLLRKVELGFFRELQLPEQLTVRDVMSETPRTVRAESLLTDTARTLARTGLGALPVVDDGDRVLGMVSEREVIRHLLAAQAFTGPDARVAAPAAVSSTKTVRDVMTRQVICVAPEQPIAEVAALMANKDVERVPVVREGRLVGFLTRGDIVRKLIGS